MGAIRLFLAISVLQSHIREHFLGPSSLYIDNRITLGMNGGYAVMFFFVVSGFLISYVLEEKYGGAAGTSEFYRARATRIYPLWWALYAIVPFITETSLLHFVAQQHWYDFLVGFFIFGSDYLLSFWTYPHYYIAPMPHGLELGWTLASEMTFYAIAPFVLKSRILPILIVISSISVRIIAFTVFPSYDNAWADWSYFFFPSTAMFFMLGHLARRAYNKISLSERTCWVLLSLVPLLLLAQDGRYGFENAYFYASIVVFALVLPRIFYATKDNRLSNFLGDLTYPLYLSHSTLIIILEGNDTPLSSFREFVLSFGNSVPGNATVKAILISLPIWILALLLATMVHFLIEIPTAAAFKSAMTLFTIRLRGGTALNSCKLLR